VTNHSGDNYRVIITDQTKIKGEPAEGDIVQVKGCAQSDEVIVASEVKVHRHHDDDDAGEVEFRGCITEISNNQWQVERWTVLITEDTQMKGERPQVGSKAQIEGHTNDAGQVVAEEVHIRGHCEHKSLIEIEGRITEVSAGDTGQIVYIQGIPVHITDDTVKNGTSLEVGVWAKADVILHSTPTTVLQTEATAYVALRIRTNRSHRDENFLKFAGELTHIDAENNVWTVSGWDFLINADTKIKGDPAEGDWVKLEASYDSEAGAYTASKIEAQSKEDDDN
jgi:hypothetical protein